MPDICTKSVKNDSICKTDKREMTKYYFSMHAACKIIINILIYTFHNFVSIYINVLYIVCF